MRLLLSNDDGVHAPGLAALAQVLSAVADVTVVAPESERSGYSSALTLDRPLRVTRLDNGFHSVSGTPADCVHLALNGFLGFEPDMVISGINAGANLGDDVIYSGTVAAALEGRFLGKTAIAVSLVGAHAREHGVDAFLPAARIVAGLLESWSGLTLPARTILNVNVPDTTEIRGCKVTRLGHRAQAGDVHQMTDPRGRRAWWIGVAGDPADAGPGTDFHAVHEGFVSITPLHTDMTSFDALAPVGQWLEKTAR